MDHPIPASSPATDAAARDDAHLPALATRQADHTAHATSHPFVSPRLAFVPLVPPVFLKAHHAFIPTDTRFRAACRLLQALWREDAGHPLGFHCPNPRAKKPKRIKLGSRLAPDAARAGSNFTSSAIHRLVRHFLVTREPGACVDETRLMANCLSSMPLAFNALGPLCLDPTGLGTTVFRLLLPDFIHELRSIQFEISPGRGDPTYLSDGTALDAVAHVTTVDGEEGLVFIEVKYSEAMAGPVAEPRSRYDEASRECGLFSDPDSAVLRRPALEQLWREAMLGQLALDRSPAAQVRFVVIGPRLNSALTDAVAKFRAELVDPSGTTPHADGRNRVGFDFITLEAVIASIALAGDTDTARALFRRYTDWPRVLRVALGEDAPTTDNDPNRSSSRKGPTASTATPTAPPAANDNQEAGRPQITPRPSCRRGKGSSKGIRQ